MSASSGVLTACHLRSPSYLCLQAPPASPLIFTTHNSSRTSSKPARQNHCSLVRNLHDSWDTPLFWCWDLSPNLYFRCHGTCELLASWHGKRLLLMPLTWLLLPPLTQASDCYLCGLVRRPFWWPNWQMMLTLTIFSLHFFAVITVILHGWRCTSTSSILTADSLLFKRKKLICFHVFLSKLGWFYCCQRFISHRSNWNSEFETGPPVPKPEVMRLFLGVITSYYFWFTYIFHFWVYCFC